MHDWSKISLAFASEDPPTGPVVPCLSCHEDFVWWLHPVQLCDRCVTVEYDRAASSTAPTADPQVHRTQERA